MQRVGLYYPYVHFRDPAWTKAVALYWPRMARVVPQGFHVRDPRHVAALRDELDFVVDVDPSPANADVARSLLRTIAHHEDELRLHYSVHDTDFLQHTGNVVTTEPHAPGRRPQRTASGRSLAGLYRREVTSELEQALLATGLATLTVRNRVDDSSGHEWLAMDPALAWVYKCALTSELSRRTAYAPITDQRAAHGAGSDWDSHRMASVLLHPEQARGPSADFVAKIGLMAIQCVLPARLGAVPIEKIIRLRRDHEAEFLAFNRALETVALYLSEKLAGVEDQQALDGYLKAASREHFEVPLEELRKAMRGVGLDTITTALSSKFDVPAAAMIATTSAAAVGGQAFGQPAGLAVAVVASSAALIRAAGSQRDDRLKNSPVSYLLRMERGLQPTTAVRRVVRTFQRGFGTGI
ncbi:DUF6236 family protein [Streptomyces mirabilis]|uniref:DUF6236 family protein n=1 Tax=Streptomyces mirabilis TaxID=68239 RepID=UPI0036C28431